MFFFVYISCVDHYHQNCFAQKIYISVLIPPFPEFLFLHDLENILLICSIGFITKSLSSIFPLIISMCYFRLSEDIIIFNNATCKSSVPLSPNTKSTIYFASLHILLFEDSTFVVVGIFVLLSFGKK